MTVTIALLQLLPEQGLEAQRRKGLSAVEEAAARGADIALFPEMWSTGYRISPNGAENQRAAVGLESPFVRSFADAARRLHIAVGITFLEAAGGAPLNSLALFDGTGAMRLHYAKVHTCAFDAERVLASGTDFSVADLALSGGTVRVGAMICFDREFPESARLLMLRGAELILAPNACPMEINRLCALRTRAYENMLSVATANYPQGQPDCNGRSTVFDGIAWKRDEQGSRDMCILEAPAGEGVYTATIDMDALRAYRAHEVMGAAYRHPALYGALAE